MFGDRNKLVTSLLEKSSAVCGSIQNTIQDEDNIEWVKSKTEGTYLKSVECMKGGGNHHEFSHEAGDSYDEFIIWEVEGLCIGGYGAYAPQVLDTFFS